MAKKIASIIFIPQINEVARRKKGAIEVSTPIILPSTGIDFASAKNVAEKLLQGYGANISPKFFVRIVADGGFWGDVSPKDITVVMSEERRELWYGHPGDVMDAVSWTGDIEREEAELYQLTDLLLGRDAEFPLERSPSILEEWEAFETLPPEEKEEGIRRVSDAALGGVIFCGGDMEPLAVKELSRRRRLDK